MERSYPDNTRKLNGPKSQLVYFGALTALALTIIGICAIHLLRTAARLAQSVELGQPVPAHQRMDR